MWDRTNLLKTCRMIPHQHKSICAKENNDLSLEITEYEEAAVNRATRTEERRRTRFTDSHRILCNHRQYKRNNESMGHTMERKWRVNSKEKQRKVERSLKERFGRNR
jgi:uncharacterized membrane protein YccC